ncbi:hypothetical protein POTOM_046567 [Populus tomentosa]|uniref:Recombination initiation defects 3 n=1 Tax=Populus tomentosa TaxID=118781 RepID=A0A8X7YQV7_POPTO|nr:hypothetical protein POTOM_046567 [Populus tomentosa]
MKLKINKACDLSSISVLPPQSRRSSSIPVGSQQASQLRSQQSQQSFSQGFSSQHGIFSQTSLDEALTIDQRFSSQEQENSMKKPSCLPVISYKREESQLPVSRSSSNIVRKWSAARVPDHKCQIYEELQHRIGMMETSLTKFGMILDSVQSDVMQVKKGVKEASLETLSCQEGFGLELRYLVTVHPIINPEGMRQKLIVLDTSLQLMEMACSLKTPLNQKCPSITVLSPKVTSHHVTPQRKPEPVKKPTLLPKVAGQAETVPKVEMGGWKSVKVKQHTFTQAASLREQKRTRVSSDQQEEQSRVIIDSDEEIDGGFSCLLDVKETGIRNPIIGETKEDTARILRKARRQKRKYCNPIIIN